MNMRRMAVLLLLMLASAHAFADSTARAWLDRNSMQLGETVTLNVETDDSSAGEPDFSALLDDFNSLGTQSSRQISMTNGSTSAKMVWAIGLEPKHAGTLTIPAFTVGSAQTDPLTLTVLAAPAGAQGKPGDNVFIEVTADPLTPYVQQQVRYTVKLYFSVDLSDGSLDEPSTSGAVVQKLGRDKRYTATVGGRRYQVLERNYALTPEQSGSMEVPALVFRGSAVDNSDPIGFFRRGRTVSARSDAIQLEVRAKPASWGNQAWLPAASLSLTEESPLPTKATVGEPLTRTIRLRAQGLGFEQLPELELEKPAGTEIYPDKPDTRTRDDGSWIYGERTRKFAIVPTRPGKLVLPEMSVVWWNTAKDQIERTVLPAHEIDVKPAAASANAPAPADTASTSAPAVESTAPATIVYPSADSGAATRFWRGVSVVLAAAWLITLVLWLRARRDGPRAGPVQAVSKQAPARSTFMRACAMGDLVGAERALVSWAKSERPGVRNIGELIAQLADEGQRDALEELLRMRYAGASSEGLGARLSRSLRSGFAWEKAEPVEAQSEALPPLYPDRR